MIDASKCKKITAKGIKNAVVKPLRAIINKIEKEIRFSARAGETETHFAYTNASLTDMGQYWIALYFQCLGYKVENEANAKHLIISY